MLESMPPPDTGPDRGSSRILVRYSGDLTTKARGTRERFTIQLLRNLKDALGPVRREAVLGRTRDRIVIELPRPIDLTPLTHVFGVQSVSLAERRAWSSLQDLVEAGRELFAEAVRNRRFAVRVRRVGDRSRIPVTGQQIERALGAVLLPGSAGVDLSTPEVTVRLEVLPGEAYLFRERLAAPGGLPLGVEGSAVALASGGFDSVVAAWLMQKRGVRLDYVFCNLGGRAHQLEAVRVLEVLARDWSHGTHPHLHAIDFDAVSRDLQAKVSQRYWQVVLKRLMLRAAERVARDRDAAAIVTGDALGQVSSQTLRNMATISEATRLPILRPLVGFNKDEILALARRIGTYELSKQVGEYCAMVPARPATAAATGVIEAEEACLDAGLLERAVEERSVFDLRELDLEAMDVRELEATGIPERATVLDVRSKAAYQAWHHPDALFMDFATALRAWRAMPKDRPYVIYCEFGLKSAHLAELMRREGFEATHWKRGLSDLLAWARTQGIATPES
jgi:thiamine biosynthesis protein ThiI